MSRFNWQPRWNAFNGFDTETTVIVPAVDFHRLRAEHGRLMRGLVELYRAAPTETARVCDETIDLSGALLGDLRKVARS